MLDGRLARLVMTERRHGDLSIHQDAATVDRRRRAVVDAPWTWLHQVHGDAVVEVARPGDHAGAEADASWTAVAHAPLAVQVADCAPVALVADSGAVGVAHAGWRGLVAGVIERLGAAMTDAGHEPTVAVRGPCIGPSEYEFGAADLDAVATVLGDTVRATSAVGAPALNMHAAVAAAVDRAGIGALVELPGCTAVDRETRWSHRARTDGERQAMVAWIERS